MNVQEQHIEVNLSSQKIASNVNRNFDPSEIDWILNKMVDRFIKDRIKEDQDSLGFDCSQLDLDALQTLSVLDYELDVYKTGTENELFADLPGDYSFLIGNSSYVIDNCNPSFKSAGVFPGASRFIYPLTLQESAKSGAPYYVDAEIKVDGSPLYTKSSSSGLQNKEELFTFRDYLLSELRSSDANPNIKIYWERFDKFYFRNSILLVSKNQFISTSLSIDGTDLGNAIESNLTRNYPAEFTTGKYRANRLIRGQARPQILQSSLFGSLAKSPISAVTNNKIKVYYGEKFRVNKLRINYIRKPAKISLVLEKDCDLPEGFHMQICDMAVLYIKELTMSPDWEVKLRDNMASKN